MKILVVSQGFYPAQKYGGPPISIGNMCELLGEEVEFYVVTSDHENGSTSKLIGIKNGWQKVGKAQVIYISDEKRNRMYLSEIVKKIKPNIIYLNSMFDASNTLKFLHIANKNKIKVLLAPRGELCKGAFKKKYKKIPYIIFLRLIGWLRGVSYQSTSDEETLAIRKKLKAKEKKIFYLPNIPSIPTISYTREKKEKGFIKIVFISRIHPKKNLKDSLEYLKYVKGEVKYDIYGPIEDKAYWDECLKIAEKLPSNINVSYKGLLKHDEVHKTFSKYDLFLFPTYSENYGHVIMEALIVGTPVIISNQTPWNDINDSKGGYALSIDNKGDFIEAIQNMIDTSNEEFYKISHAAQMYARDKINIEKLKEEYTKVFEEVIL